MIIHNITLYQVYLGNDLVLDVLAKAMPGNCNDALMEHPLKLFEK